METVIDMIKRRAGELQNEITNYDTELAKLQARVDEVTQARRAAAAQAVEYAAAAAKLQEAKPQEPTRSV